MLFSREAFGNIYLGLLRHRDWDNSLIQVVCMILHVYMCIYIYIQNMYACVCLSSYTYVRLCSLCFLARGGRQIEHKGSTHMGFKALGVWRVRLQDVGLFGRRGRGLIWHRRVWCETRVWGCDPGRANIEGRMVSPRASMIFKKRHYSSYSQPSMTSALACSGDTAC